MIDFKEPENPREFYSTVSEVYNIYEPPSIYERPSQMPQGPIMSFFQNLQNVTSNMTGTINNLPKRLGGSWDILLAKLPVFMKPARQYATEVSQASKEDSDSCTNQP